jgi:hypothetical protein
LVKDGEFPELSDIVLTAVVCPTPICCAKPNKLKNKNAKLYRIVFRVGVKNFIVD